MQRPDLVGQRFGRLVVKAMVYERHAKCLCRCECGKEKVIRVSSLRAGCSNSCGCLASQRIAKANYRHGQSSSPEWRVWRAMRQRCQDPSCTAYKDYGGRGISVCERWDNSFEAFLADMGPRPAGMQIDRTNNDGNYEPSNCRWVTCKENSNNRRKAKKSTKPALAGEDHPTAKLTWAQVHAIRSLSAAGGLSHAEIGRRFGVKNSSVWKIVNGRTWKHVEQVEEAIA